MTYFLQNVLCALEKNMYSVAVLNMFVSLSYHSVMVFSLVFCLNDLYTNKSGIINPSCCFLSISPFSSINICSCSSVIMFCYLDNLTALSLYCDLFVSWWPMEVSLLVESYCISIATTVLFLFAWHTFIYYFSFNLSVSLRLKWFSCRENIVASCYF